MSPVELAWVAGFVEGEGCFRFRTKGPHKYPTVQVDSTDHDVLVNLAEVTGMGHITGPRRRLSWPNHYKPIYTWTVSRSAEAVSLMRELYPLLGKRRQQQIESTYQDKTPMSTNQDSPRGWKR